MCMIKKILYEILRELIKSLIVKRFLPSKETQIIKKSVEDSSQKVRKSSLGIFLS